jgi:SAM-dependent methyltransferase
LTWRSNRQFDLVILDNVYEHIPQQDLALERISALLKPGGAFYVVVPNKLWPMEVHYGLPFLSYLPVPLANAYLRITKRGTDYTDASFAPTYWSLKRQLAKRPELRYEFVLPADLSLTETGNSPLYRLGATAIRTFPGLWAISKALLVVGTRQ